MEDYLACNKSAYDQTASEYLENRPLFNENNRQVAVKFAGFLDKKCPGKKNKSILDLGVGSGLDLSIFEEMGYLTYGLDISDKMIDVARTNAPKTTFYYGDFLEFQFGRQFSGIYAQAFIHLFPKEKVPDIFGKMNSLLELEGLIHFSTTVHELSSEGLEEKMDYKTSVKRYRKRWTIIELNEFLEGLSFLETIHQYMLRDPKGKIWANTIVGKKI